MKTKNIFRMLLVAAALLMGANNVKADTETPLWNGPGTTTFVKVDGSAFSNLTGTSYKLRVYTDAGQQIFVAAGSDENNEGNDEPLFYTDYGSNHDTWIRNYENYNSSAKCFEFTLTSSMITKLSTKGLIVKQYNANISKVSLVEVSGGEEGGEQGGQQGGDQTNDYITINAISHGYRTYVTTQAINFGGSQNIEGYYASEVSGNNVVFTKVTGVCASDVPLLLVKTGSGDCKLLKSSDTGTEPPTNFLHPGETVNGKGKVVNDSRQYVLTWHNNAPVFAETNVNAARVDAEHAYLVLPSNASGRLRISFKHDDDDLTGIQSLQSDERSLDGAIYNLRGQRVERPTKGIYIINGKKVIIK